MIRASDLKRSKTRWANLSKLEKREARWGYAFISLWLVGFFLFYFLPMLASLGFSLMDFRLGAPDESKFVGLDNWHRLLFRDPTVWQSLGVTFKFALISLPITMGGAFFLAVLLNSEHLLAKPLFRTLFFAPSIMPFIAVIIIWTGVLNPATGWLNGLIEWLTGLDVQNPSGLQWLDKPNLVYVALSFMALWGIGGAMLINLAGLQGVPTDLYDAAKIDGANWWHRLFAVTLPMMTPVIFYNLLLSIVSLLQYFVVPFVLNSGTGYPNGATQFYMIWFYKQTFTFQDMGYGAALAWFIFLIALVITLALFGSARYWVYYAGQRD
jgi:multiple sugar transport system permease protein